MARFDRLEALRHDSHHVRLACTRSDQRNHQVGRARGRLRDRRDALDVERPGKPGREIPPCRGVERRGTAKRPPSRIERQPFGGHLLCLECLVRLAAARHEERDVLRQGEGALHVSPPIGDARLQPRSSRQQRKRRLQRAVHPHGLAGLHRNALHQAAFGPPQLYGARPFAYIRQGGGRGATPFAVHEHRRAGRRALERNRCHGRLQVSGILLVVVQLLDRKLPLLG